jgi:hypothetical protein
MAYRYNPLSSFRKAGATGIIWTNKGPKVLYRTSAGALTMQTDSGFSDVSSELTSDSRSVTSSNYRFRSARGREYGSKIPPV